MNKVWLALVRYFSGVRRASWTVAALGGLVLFAVLQQLLGSYEKTAVLQSHDQMVARLAGYNSALTAALTRRLLILEGLRAYAEGELNTHAGQIVSEEFVQVASSLYESNPGLVGIWLAPDGIQRASVPEGLPGSGLDLLRSLPPERASEVAEAIRSRQVVPAPPEFIQDKLEMQARLAIFYQSRFWGLVSVTLDLERVIAEAGLTANMGDTRLAMKSTGGMILMGDAATFQQDPVLEVVSYPGGVFTLAAVPAAGWLEMIRSQLDVLRLAALVLSLMVGLVLYLAVNRQTRLAAAVAQRTGQLDLELAERRRVEQEVRESEQKYRTLVETAPDAVLLQSLDGRVVEFNEAACLIFGYEHAEVDGMFITDLLPQQVAEGVPLQALNEMTTGGAFVETRFRRKNRQEFAAEVSSSKVSVGGQTFIISYVRDISRRKEAEEAAGEIQGRYRSLVETSPDAIALTSERGLVVLANRSAAQLYDFDTPEEMVGANVFDLIAAEDRQRAIEAARALQRGAPYRDVEFTSVTRKGRHFASELSASANYDGQGKITGFTGIARDISERKVQAREQAALVVVASALRTAVTLEGISENILNQLLGLLAAEGAALFVVIPATSEVLCVRGVSRWQAWSGLRLAKGEGITSRVITTGQPFVNNDVMHHPSTARLEVMGGLNAVAGAPLIAQERTIGALWVGRDEPFRQGELRVLMVIADMVASAVQRASLYEETSRRLQRLDALHQIDQTITAAQSLRQVLDFLLDKLMSQLGVDAAGVFLVEEKSQGLYFLAGRGFRRSSLRGMHLQPGEGCAGQVASEGRTITITDLRVQSQESCRTQVEGEDFISYTGLPLVAKQQMRGVLEVYDRTLRQPDPEWLDFLETLAGQAAIAIDNSILLESLQHTNQELVLAYDRTLEGWARALELRDKETEGHTRRVADLTVKLGLALGMSAEELVQVRRGALLHDIGKLGIPDNILLKKGALSEEEWQVMHLHPTYARALIEPIPYLRPAIVIPYSHHEHWDGSGYPQGLKGEQIPLAARIFTAIDVWDALTSDRVYRSSWTPEQARQYLRDNSGILFDPQVIEVFFNIGMAE